MVSTPKSPVLIVAPNPDGHRLYYVALLAASAASNGSTVKLATTHQALDSPEWETHLSNMDLETELLDPNEFSLSKLAVLASSYGAGVTVVPDGDGLLGSALIHGWRGSGTLSLLMMRPDAQSGGPTRPLKDVLKKLLLIATDLRKDVRAYALRSPLHSRRWPVKWVPDPITVRSDPQTTQQIRLELDGHDCSYWVGVFGVVSKRKHLHLVLDGLVGQEGVGLMVAGTIDAEALESAESPLSAFKAAGGTFLQWPGPLSEAAFDSAIGCVDCVVVAHSNEGSSGVAGKAAALGKRLVLAGARSLRRDARHLDGQASWAPLDSAAIGQAIAKSRTWSPRPSNPALASVSQFTESLLRASDSIQR